MTTSIPTRITIELEPADERRGGWRARTRIDGRAARERDHGSSTRVASATAAMAEEPDVAWTPAPYEPGPCTCEGGLCDRDHENE